MRTHLFLVFSGFVYFNLIVSCLNNDQNFKDIKQPYPNIIFISIDDLRPELNCYGKKDIISPNINELSNHSFLLYYVLWQLYVKLYFLSYFLLVLNQ